jgi:hypothetical protein
MLRGAQQDVLLLNVLFPRFSLPDSTLMRRLPGLPLLLALLALAGAVYYYFAGESAVLPVQLVPHLAPLPLTLDSVAAGPARLPLPVSGFLTTLTHDLSGPYTQPLAATLWLSVLALALAGWLAVVSMLRRPAFLAGMVPVIFLLLALNADALGIFVASKQYFLYLSLGVLGAAALGLQAFGDRVRVAGRVAIFGVLVVALVGLIVSKTKLPLAETALHLAAYATPASAMLVAALVLWVGLENVRALLWFNTQAERPESRFGLLPFLAASFLYLGALALYWWNGDTLTLAGGLHLDPLVLLLPAVVVSGLGLRQRAPTYAGWLPFVAARPLYWLLVAAASAALGYALATANAPLLAAARGFSALALGLLGAAFLLYVVINFGGLLQQRLRVYRVVFEPRRLPFYTVYIMALATLLLLELRNGWPLANQVQAGQYNQLGDLARQQSEGRPDDLPLALLAERYYAESGDVLARFNRSAQLGRAALYRFRGQRQNEVNALRRALLRQPDEKISLRLNALLTEPADFLDALEGLRQARRAAPRSFPLTSDLAQLFTRSALADSVAFYLDKAEQLRPGSYVGRTNQLGFLLSQNLVSAAQKLASTAKSTATEPSLLANQELLQLLTAAPQAPPAPVANVNLDAASFAHIYQAALLTARAKQPGPARHLVAVLAKLAERPANEPYYEQLLFLQALLRHAAGQELAARQTLAPLTVGTTATAGYYQYVLGMWQLQQQQYATAANQLTQAAAHGAADARLPRAWALALSGQADSARAAQRRLAADPTQRAATAQLGQVLQNIDLLKVTKSAVAGSQELAAAQRAAADKQLPEATRRYQALVQQTPFNEPAMLAAARFFTQQKAYTDAYDALNVGLAENPASLPLLQAYALAAADAGLADLGQSALDQLRPRLSPAQYATLLAQFAGHRAAHAAASAAFDQPPVPAR